MVVVAEGKRRSTLAKALANLDAELRFLAWDASVADVCDAQTTCVVIGEKPPVASTRRFVKTLRSLVPSEVVLVVVASKGTSPSKTRNLYNAGAAIVFEWPRESKLFGSVIAELLGLRMARGRAASADRRLSRAVKARLRAERPSFSQLEVKCRDGMVELAGQVDALWEEEELAEMVADVPGVRSLRTDELRVAPVRVADEGLVRRVRMVVDSVAERPRSISIAVSGKRATLAGTVATRLEGRRVEELVRHVRGLRGVENLLVVSTTLQKRDATLAKEIKRTLNGLRAGQSVNVDVLSGVAVVHGWATGLAAKFKVLRKVQAHDGVDRVVDKVRVR